MAGPTTPISIQIDEDKYRLEGETFDGKVDRIARTLADTDEHYEKIKDILMEMRFLPAGRVQTAIGSPRQVTAFNCYVSLTIDDSMESIMKRATQAAETMRKGGGIGYDFSRIRPKGDWIKTLESKASGPISFMRIYDAICQCIASSGHRRGAQMGVLRVDHPDIEEYIDAKQNSDALTGFNVSIGITDEFMNCLFNSLPFDLKFEGKVYKTVDPSVLWDKIMRATWDWAEPGVLFIDRINEMNNLYYCETIEATNPCGEQPLPPAGACLLGSFNLVKYVKKDKNNKNFFDSYQLSEDIPEIVRMMDNVIDNTIYPLPEQEQEAKNKRRMGLGITGLANAGEMLGYPYASKDFMIWMEGVLELLRNMTYSSSCALAKEKGAFPLFDKKQFFSGKFFQTLPDDVKVHITQYGLRNSHLTSIAPTGTISLMADNVSSGIEPPFSHYYDRTYRTFDGDQIERVTDYAYAKGYEGRTSDSISVEDHLKVLIMAQQYVDSAVSKTCNVGDDVTFEEFRKVYEDAYKGGAKGITTFRASGKRFGVLNKVSEEPKAEACYIDPETGIKECE